MLILLCEADTKIYFLGMSPPAAATMMSLTRESIGRGSSMRPAYLLRKRQCRQLYALASRCDP